jgi:hypothetical protein
MRNVMYGCCHFHFTSLHFTSLPIPLLHFTAFFLMISTPPLLGLIYRFPNSFPKIAWFTGESPYFSTRHLCQIGKKENRCRMPSETTFLRKRRHISEDGVLHTHRCGHNRYSVRVKYVKVAAHCQVVLARLFFSCTVLTFRNINY